MSRKSSWLVVVACVALGWASLVRAQAIGPGFELERSGRYADAANIYFATLRADPTNIPALLGLERTLFVLNRMPELLPPVQAARALLPDSPALRSLELRVYAALNEPDSVETLARRWAASAPGSEVPYREWGQALADRRMWDDARRAFLAGRRTLGGDGTLALELAQLEQRTGNWEVAASEWGRAVTRTPDVEPTAATQLGDAPVAMRDRIARVLTAPGAPVGARRLAAELLLAWGEPNEAWTAMQSTLTPVTPETPNALRRFTDLASVGNSPEAHRVRGFALNRWADLVPWSEGSRARAEAVRELLAGGDKMAARRVLERLTTDSTAPPEAHTAAETALLHVLIADGQLDVAEERLSAPPPHSALSADDRATLRLALATARIARGELDRADSALGTDSSIAATAQRGWIALYRGDLQGAMEAFRAAGPYAADRAAATERTSMMAMLQQIQRDSSRELGAALLTLARGDSVGAIAALRRAAAKLPAQGGRLDVLLLAAEVAAQKGGDQEQTAVALFDDIVRAGGEGAAPAAAELEWARLLVESDRAAEAIPHLEHMILTYPNSAFVPEARRLLERAKGSIPKS